MATVCEICGKKPTYGNRVSHAHNLTRRRWEPNLRSVRSQSGGTVRKVRICTQCLKSDRIQKPLKRKV